MSRIPPREWELASFFLLCGESWRGQPKGRYHTAWDDTVLRVVFGPKEPTP